MSKISIMYQSVGKRKTSISHVTLYPGKGNIVVNNKHALDFFPYKTLVQDLTTPLVVTDTLNKFDVKVRVHGGGFTGQAGAIRLGISRALLKISNDFKPILRQAGLLTRDSRIKERKKYGLKKARKAPQYSKR